MSNQDAVRSVMIEQSKVLGVYTAPMPVVREKDFKRFSQNVRFDEKTGCHLWTGTVLQSGYGQFCVGGKDMLAHRAAYLFAHGDIPDGLCVLHACDVKGCVNSSHLFLGTRRDNTQDMIQKGRQRWEGNVKLRLTSAEKDLIWSMRLDGATFYRIGKVLGRPQQTIKHAYLSLRKKRIN